MFEQLSWFDASLRLSEPAPSKLLPAFSNAAKLWHMSLHSMVHHGDWVSSESCQRKQAEFVPDARIA